MLLEKLKPASSSLIDIKSSNKRELESQSCAKAAVTAVARKDSLR
jgi:hypothetical protein